MVNEKFTIYDEYNIYHSKYCKLYGPRTIVIMQVGAFYEIYSLNDGNGPNLEPLSDLLDSQLTMKNKNKPLSNSNPYLVGFPLVATTKHCRRMVDDGRTVVIVDQVTAPPNSKRDVVQIISPGTFVEELNTPDAHYIMSIFIEEEPQINGELCWIIDN